MKKALISGITGQDGSYLAELLLEKGYEVHALIRRTSTPSTDRIKHLLSQNNLVIHTADLPDSPSIFRVIRETQPDECYNLAAQSHVKESFDIPEYTAQVTGVSPINFLEAIRQFSPHTKFYQASSSEMFGKVKEVPQTETTPFHPRSPYGVAKVFAYWITVNYRESYGLFSCNGILFNHESPRRGETFVTKKITKALAEIAKGRTEPLQLGNLEAQRDWGYAKDYVDAMWRMLQQEKPDDYVVATNETHSVREFVEESCKVLNIDLEWHGKNENEKGVDKKTGNTIIEINPAFYRPAEVDQLIGDYAKAQKELGWKPTTTFKELVHIMVDADLKALQ